MNRIAIIGECMVELNGRPFGEMQQTFGGDTLNAAVYASRCLSGSTQVSYVTALGADPLSKGMQARWEAEGIDTSLVLTDPARTVGAYLIQLDEKGERTFMYWRTNTPASHMVKHPEFEQVKETIIQQANLVFLSGISLAILDNNDREAMLNAIRRFRQAGIAIAFDSNYRPVLWDKDKDKDKVKVIDKVRSNYARMYDTTDLALVTFDDEAHIWGDASPYETVARLVEQHGVKEVIVKLGANGCLIGGREITKPIHVATEEVKTVVDTTSAGDSFNGGFLSGYISGLTLVECCQRGNALASIVIQHRGAIIPKEHTEHLVK